MVIRVTPTGATVEDADNLRDLRVAISGVDDATAATAISAAGLGTLDGDHAWLDVAALRARGTDTDAWRASFDDMTAYARTKGWVDGTRVRAHVVRG
jgi:hypothetical protein